MKSQLTLAFSIPHLSFTCYCCLQQDVQFSFTTCGVSAQKEAEEQEKGEKTWPLGV